MKSSLLILMLALTATTAVFAQDESDIVDETPDLLDEPEEEVDGFAVENLDEFLEAYKEKNKEKMAKLTIEIVKFSKSFQRRAKLMVAVKSQVLKMLKRFTDMERFGAMRQVILNLLMKLTSKDNKTPANLQSMIDWVEKRKIDGNSAESNLDDAQDSLKTALAAFKATQEPVVRAVEGIREATARGAAFDQEKVRELIQEVWDAAEANREKFLPSIEAAVKGFDLTVSRLRLREE
jgi:hypothetical protein